ncbi:MAG: hypothetical protein JO111_13260 [Caulobacteraceae bacterium]|nr:hypothetical protein [Caulobacteraceae bacterium]
MPVYSFVPYRSAGGMLAFATARLPDDATAMRRAHDMLEATGSAIAVAVLEDTRAVGISRALTPQRPEFEYADESLIFAYARAARAKARAGQSPFWPSADMATMVEASRQRISSSRALLEQFQDLETAQVGADLPEMKGRSDGIHAGGSGSRR